MIRFSLVFLLGFIFSVQANASFAENQRRYLAPFDFYTLLMQKYPVVQVNHSNCHILSRKKLSSAGASQPLTGQAASRTPNASFVSWYGKCIRQYLRRTLRVPSDRNREVGVRLQAVEILLPKALQAEGTPEEIIQHAEQLISSGQWKNLSQREKYLLMRHAVNYLLGPNAVLRDISLRWKSQSQAASALAKAFEPSPDTLIIDVLKRTHFTLIMSDEFLTK